MSFPRKYALMLVVPPIVVALPVALAFLAHVTRVKAGESLRIAAAALIAYSVGAAVAAVVLAGAARSVDVAITSRSSAGHAVSAALSTTTLASLALWVAWGLVVSLAGCAAVLPTWLGVQYFGEAMLIVAAPAMAWSYWTGKGMLLRAADGAADLEYTGRVWSIGAKIAIVFIGFFFVSAGALVLVISSRVGNRLGEAAAHEIATFGFGIAVATTAIFGVATWFLARDIRMPMAELVRIAEELAEGRFDGDVKIFSDDEVGVVSRSFGSTRRNLRALVGSVGDHGQSLTGGVRQISTGTDALVENVHEQSGMAVETSAALAVVQDEAQSVLREVDRVAELTYDSSGSATELRASFAEVARRMDELFQSVEKSSSAATQIDASACETAGRTTNLASIGTDVLTFVAEMDATVEQIMRTAQATADLSDKMRENAVAGRSAVDATVTGIRNAQDSTRRTAGAFDSLHRSIGQIDQILLFIDDVTNRTNLLSLNAAIIAAQAGRNDYGFSVIADEVRQLAERTRTATKEIATIIKAIQPVAKEALTALEAGVHTVDETVDLAHNAAASLEKILESADRSQEMTLSISRALQEQAQASSHLHGVTARMSDHIVEMQRATAGQADATRMLAAEAELVSDIALQVKRATGQQTDAGESIATAMEQIAADVGSIRDRLGRQLQQSEQIASASKITLSIAERNNTIAEQFRTALRALLDSGRDFESEVARFRT